MKRKKQKSVYIKIREKPYKKKYINSINNVRVFEKNLKRKDSRQNKHFLFGLTCVQICLCFQLVFCLYLFGRVRCHEMISFNPFRRFACSFCHIGQEKKKSKIIHMILKNCVVYGSATNWAAKHVVQNDVVIVKV